MLIRTSCFKQDEKLTKQIVKTEREVLIRTSCFKQDEKLTKQIVKTEREGNGKSLLVIWISLRSECTLYIAFYRYIPHLLVSQTI